MGATTKEAATQGVAWCCPPCKQGFSSNAAFSIHIKRNSNDVLPTDGMQWTACVMHVAWSFLLNGGSCCISEEAPVAVTSWQPWGKSQMSLRREYATGSRKLVHPSFFVPLQASRIDDKASKGRMELTNRHGESRHWAVASRSFVVALEATTPRPLTPPNELVAEAISGTQTVRSA